MWDPGNEGAQGCPSLTLTPGLPMGPGSPLAPVSPCQGRGTGSYSHSCCSPGRNSCWVEPIRRGQGRNFLAQGPSHPGHIQPWQGHMGSSTHP